MKNEESSLYDNLPLELFAGFYYEINKNIENGILSDAMYNKNRLIEQAALKRGIPLQFLNDSLHMRNYKK